jgi:Uncharacterized protein conserved in bacteria
MFIEKIGTEIITVDCDITVAGITLDTLGFPKKFEKIGEMWGIYESKYRKTATNCKLPVMNYGFWFNKSAGDYDYIVGSAVDETSTAHEDLTVQTIPAGRYIKAYFNAKDFTDLVCGNGIGDSFARAKQYAEDNYLTIRAMSAFPIGSIEVYPHDMMCVGKDNGPEWGLALDDALRTPSVTEYPEMYTLTPIE